MCSLSFDELVVTSVSNSWLDCPQSIQ